MGVASLIISLVGITLGGILGGVSGGLAASKKKREAQRLLREQKKLERMAEEKAIDTEQAKEAVRNLIASAKGDIKSMLQEGLRRNLQRLAKTYSRNLEKAFQNIRNVGVQQRLPLESMSEAQQQVAQTLLTQYGEQSADITARISDAIKEQITQLNLMGGKLEREEELRGENIADTLFSEISQLGMMAESMKDEAIGLQELGMLSGLSTGLAGLGDIITTWAGGTTSPQTEITKSFLTEPKEIGNVEGIKPVTSIEKLFTK